MTVLFHIITASEIFFAVNIHGLLPSFDSLFLRGGDGGWFYSANLVPLSRLPVVLALQRILRLLIKQLGVIN